MLTLTHNLFEHWSKVPRSIWVWENFTPKEIASRGDGSILIVPEALDKLQKLRNMLGRPLFIDSAYRDAIHNARVGGAPLSNHRKGIAFDINLINQDKDKLYNAAKACDFTGFGFYNSFLHIDCGEPREWRK